MKKKQFAFPKSNRLCSKLSIEKLFSSPHISKCYPLFCNWLQDESLTTHQFLPIVPKRIFKRALDRNRIKRQLKEIWRLNQSKITTEKFYLISLRQISKEKKTYSELEKAVLKSIKKINETA